MFETALSAAACLLLLAVSLHVLFRRISRESAVQSASILALCMTEAAGWLMKEYGYWRPAVIAESFLPFAVLALGTAWGRKWPARPAFPPPGALAALSLVFPVAAAMLPLGWFFPRPWAAGGILPLGAAGYVFYLGIMLYCAIALFNLEATFRYIPAGRKWETKLEATGYGAMLAVLIFYFSQGLLYRSINLNFGPVMSGVFIISSILVLYSRHFRGGDGKVTVSRYILYRSVTALVVGGYLIIIGLIGMEVKYLGISFGRSAAVFAAFAAGIFTVILLLSAQFRREVKVFISKNFFDGKHDYREVWLSFTGRLERCRTLREIEDSVLRTFIDAFGLGGAALYLLNRERGVHVLSSSHAVPDKVKEVRLSDGLVSYFLDRKRVLDPGDGEYAPSGGEAEFFSRTGASLAVPLALNGELEGFVLLGKRLSHEKLTYEDFDLMKTLAKQSSLALSIFRLSEELAQARAVAAMARMSSFVIHDLKNLASTLSLVLENSRYHIDDPDFQKDMVSTVGNTLSRMLEIIRRLKSAPDKGALKPEPGDLHEMAMDVAREISKANRRGTAIECGGTPVICRVDAEEMRKVITNLLLNSIEATDERGVIGIETGRSGGYAFIRAKDNGCGMSKSFIQTALFRPFMTTKSRGLGIGLFQCRQIVEAHEGRIEVESAEGEGSIFTVYLPLYPPLAETVESRVLVGRPEKTT